MPSEGYVHREIARTLVRGAAILQDAVNADRIGWHVPRDAKIDDVDHATDRIRSEQQGGRPAQYLDPFGGQRVDRNRVILARGRQVEAADAVS